ncbi:unnamed protein product [Cylindrotheca closterium]|uniref:Ferredoxin n=1 Tax=Cylindrotheca closterium TaxID=2856 RepID=A0AAD2FRB2_9STRA|nr:unnamed protein product [Cylindrotheca closterium]
MWYSVGLVLLWISQTRGFQPYHAVGSSSRGSSFCRIVVLKLDNTKEADSESSPSSSSSSFVVQQQEEEEETEQDENVAAAASKFQITTCLSPSCNRKRQEAGLDPLSTFAAMYERSKRAAGADSDLFVTVEEGPCMGACQYGPCIAIQHDDFEGSVSLEGMTDTEFSDRVFQEIVTEEDADRVWRSVESAVQLMAEDEEE